MANRKFVAISSTIKGAKEKAAKQMIDNFYDIFGHSNSNESSFESASSSDDVTAVNSVGALYTLCIQFGFQSPE